MARFQVEYIPRLSVKGFDLIEENITPSMTSNDGESNQYNIDIILSDLLKELSSEDRKQLQLLQVDNVDYIEF
jgi:hypothetical protein